MIGSVPIRGSQTLLDLNTQIMTTPPRPSITKRLFHVFSKSTLQGYIVACVAVGGYRILNNAWKKSNGPFPHKLITREGGGEI